LADEVKATQRHDGCLFCDVARKDADYFIEGPYGSGICGDCVGYLMSTTAIDDRTLFENHVERARRFGDNNDAARTARNEKQ